MAFEIRRARGVYGKPWSKMSKLPISKEVLEKLGKCLVEIIVKEAKKDFAKRGWSGRDPKGGPPIWDSFSYQIRGESTLEIMSSFYGISELVSGDIPKRKMDWLHSPGVQPASGPKRADNNRQYTRQPGKPSNRSPAAQRKTRIIPLRTSSGKVIFRTAPFRTQNSWVHPGIAKFTFMQRAIRKGRQECARILGAEAVRQLAQGDPLK